MRNGRCWNEPTLFVLTEDGKLWDNARQREIEGEEALRVIFSLMQIEEICRRMRRLRVLRRITLAGSALAGVAFALFVAGVLN